MGTASSCGSSRSIWTTLPFTWSGFWVIVWNKELDLVILMGSFQLGCSMVLFYYSMILLYTPPAPGGGVLVYTPIIKISFMIFPHWVKPTHAFLKMSKWFGNPVYLNVKCIYKFIGLWKVPAGVCLMVASNRLIKQPWPQHWKMTQCNNLTYSLNCA